MHRQKSEIENSLRTNKSLLKKVESLFSQLKTFLTSLLVLADTFYFSKVMMRGIKMEEFSLKLAYLIYFLWSQASVFHEQILENFSEIFSFKNAHICNFSFCELFDKKNLLYKTLERNKPITTQLANKYCLLGKVIEVGILICVYDPTLSFMDFLSEEEEFIVFEERSSIENLENIKTHFEKGQKLILHDPSDGLLHYFQPLLKEYESGKWNEKEHVIFNEEKLKCNPKFKLIIILSEKKLIENLYFIKNRLIIYNDINESKLWNQFFGAIFFNKTSFEEKSNILMVPPTFAEVFWKENEELFVSLSNEIKKISSNDEDCKEIVALYEEVKIKVAEVCNEDYKNMDLLEIFFKKIRKAKSPSSENKSNSLLIIQNRSVKKLFTN